ncbi:unnamed protein product, partial [Tetraodon nigroviridis]
WQACAPLWSQECGTSAFSTGICTSVSDNLEPGEAIAPTSQSKNEPKSPDGPEKWLKHLVSPCVSTHTHAHTHTHTRGRVLHIHGYRDCAGWLQQHLPLVRGPELPQQHPQQVPHQHGPNAGGHTPVRRGGLARVVTEGLPDHTGGGGGRQEHQQTGGQGDAHRLRHPQGLVSPPANLPASSFGFALHF